MTCGTPLPLGGLKLVWTSFLCSIWAMLEFR
jgi:hypothetical protein